MERSDSDACLVVDDSDHEDGDDKPTLGRSAGDSPTVTPRSVGFTVFILVVLSIAGSFTGFALRDGEPTTSAALSSGVGAPPWQKEISAVFAMALNPSNSSDQSIRHIRDGELIRSSLDKHRSSMSKDDRASFKACD